MDSVWDISIWTVNNTKFLVKSTASNEINRPTWKLFTSVAVAGIWFSWTTWLNWKAVLHLQSCIVIIVLCQLPSLRDWQSAKQSGKAWMKWIRLPKKHWMTLSVLPCRETRRNIVKVLPVWCSPLSWLSFWFTWFWQPRLKVSKIHWLSCWQCRWLLPELWSSCISEILRWIFSVRSVLSCWSVWWRRTVFLL